MSSMSMTALEATKQKRTHVRWIVCGLMWAAIAINFIDRTTLAIATPHIMQDLSITTEEMGMVMSAFFVMRCFRFRLDLYQKSLGNAKLWACPYFGGLLLPH